MCCAVKDVTTPREAKARPNWKCNEFVIVSNIPTCEIPLKPDGTEIISGYWEGLVGNPKDLGKMAGNEIKEKIDDSFFKQENFSH